MIKQTVPLVAFTLFASLTQAIQSLPAHLDINQKALYTMAAEMPSPFHSFQCNGCSEDQLHNMIKKNAEMLDVFTLYTTAFNYDDNVVTTYKVERAAPNAFVMQSVETPAFVQHYFELENYWREVSTDKP